MANAVVDGILADLNLRRGQKRAAWNKFQAVKAEAAKLGPVLLVDKATLEGLERASAAYDAACDEVAAVERTLAHVAEGTARPDAVARRRGELLAGLGTSWPDAAADEIFAWAASLGAQQRAGMGMLAMPTSPTFKLMSAGQFSAAITSTQSYPSAPVRRAGVVPLPAPPLNLLDLIPVVPVDARTIEVLKEKTFTNAAAETAEGDEAPEGTLAYEKEDVDCKSIPLYLPATKQVLGDKGQLRSFISSRMIRGVRERLQAQLVVGDGTGENLLGMRFWEDTLTHEKGADTVLADVIHKAKTKAIVATQGIFQPQSLLIHPNDYEDVVLQKDGDSKYYLGPGGADGTRPICGLQPVLSTGIAEGSPIVFDATACEIYAEGDVQVLVTDSHLDGFRRGVVYFMAFGRFAVGVLEPRAFVKVSL